MRGNGDQLKGFQPAEYRIFKISLCVHCYGDMFRFLLTHFLGGSDTMGFGEVHINPTLN